MVGYYLDVRRPPIGGKLPLSTYTKQCPPIFCNELMNGGKKKSSKTYSYIESIKMLDKMSNRMSKDKLVEIIGTATSDNMKTFNFHKYFNKPTMRVISSITIMNLLNSKLSNHKNRIKHISKIMKTNSANILQLGGQSIKINSLNHLLNELQSNKQIGGGEKLNKIIEKIKQLARPIDKMLNVDISF